MHMMYSEIISAIGLCFSQRHNLHILPSQKEDLGSADVPKCEAALIGKYV